MSEEACVFFPEEKCPVQERMKDFMALDKIEPNDSSEALKFAHAATKALGASSTMILQALATFCGSCPHKNMWIYNKYAPEPVEHSFLKPEGRLEVENK